MATAIAALFAASGVLIGWAIGSAVAARRLRRRRVTESMKQYDDLVKAFRRTARTTKETYAND
jgi:Na+/glutamate symporter